MPGNQGWYTRAETRQTPVPTADQLLDGLLARTQQRMQRLNDQYLRMMGEHLRDIGTLWPSDIHRLQQIRRMNRNLIDLEVEIAKAAGVTIADVHRTFTQIAQTDYRMGAKILGQPNITRVSDNPYLKQIIQAQSKETGGTLRNLSNTTVTSAAYRRAIDEGCNAVVNGVEDYNTAIRRVIRNAGALGLRMRPDGTRAVDYLSGHSRRLDTAARMNILDGARHVNQDVRNLVGEEFGADGVEIDAHMLCAEDHLPYQGMQFSAQNFELLQNSLRRPFGEWNCRHTWAPIIMGFSAPRYTQQELDEMRQYSTEQITIDGKTHSRYEWSQVQRRIETAVRQQKDTATLARYAGDTELQRQCQERIRALNDQYDRVSAGAGLEPEYTRTDVFGFRDFRETALTENKDDGTIFLQRVINGHDDNIQPMPEKQLNRIIKSFTDKGGVIQMDAQTDRYLEDYKQASGETLNATTILLHTKPSRATVFEELIHTWQFRTGRIPANIALNTPEGHLIMSRCEVEAKEKLLRCAKAYGLTDAEIEETKILLEQDKLDVEHWEGVLDSEKL